MSSLVGLLASGCAEESHLAGNCHEAIASWSGFSTPLSSAKPGAPVIS